MKLDESGLREMLATLYEESGEASHANFLRAEPLGRVVRNYDMNTALMFARAVRDAAYAEAAEVATSLRGGVAVEINGGTMPLGVMAGNPAFAQRQTADAIATVIRNLIPNKQE